MIFILKDFCLVPLRLCFALEFFFFSFRLVHDHRFAVLFYLSFE